MGPHAAPSTSRFPFDVLVRVTVGGYRMSFPDEPFPNVLAVAGYGADRASVLVVILDLDVNVLAGDRARGARAEAPFPEQPSQEKSSPQQ